jgi:hypothetical protein
VLQRKGFITGVYHGVYQKVLLRGFITGFIKRFYQKVLSKGFIAWVYHRGFITGGLSKGFIAWVYHRGFITGGLSKGFITGTLDIYSILVIYSTPVIYPGV